MPRIARVVVPNYPHHVTQRGTNKTNIFIDDDDRGYFLQCLKESAVKTKTKIWVYCLMDNHFHLLLVPEKEQGLGKCLHGVTFKYAQYFNQKYGRSGRLWQNRYFSCIVDKNEYLWVAARYIERNPVRAKIVKSAEDWKWSSTMFHINGGGREFPGIHDWLDESERIEYRRFIKGEEGEIERIRKTTSTGRPLGGMKFVEGLEGLIGKVLKLQKSGRPRKVNKNMK